MLSKRGLLAALLLSGFVVSAAPAWDAAVAKDFVALSFASACEEKDILAWKCPWCVKTGGDYAQFKPDAYASHGPTQGAAFTGYNAKTRQVFVVYRSTVLTKWQSIMVDFTFNKVDFKTPDGKVRGQVHQGFHDAYFALGEAGVFASLQKLVKEHPDAGLVAVGHSLGGALATMAAADLTTRFPGKSLLVYTFGSPRLGDKPFSAWFATLPVTYYRSVTADDPVPHTPKLAQDFLHVGSGQEQWFKNIDDAKPQTCPLGENGKCANTVKMPTNFAGAHASYLGHKFDQCGIGALAEAQAWGKGALTDLTDAYDEAKHGLSKAADKTSDKAGDLADKAKDKLEDAEDEVEEAKDDVGDAAKKAKKKLKKIKLPKVKNPF